MARDMLILPQLEALVSDAGAADWHFPPEAVALGKSLIAELESGRVLP